LGLASGSGSTIVGYVLLIYSKGLLNKEEGTSISSGIRNSIVSGSVLLSRDGLYNQCITRGFVVSVDGMGSYDFGENISTALFMENSTRSELVAIFILLI